ncbi:hypothetical protein VE03_02017 [Pseudogymnoascus sp. 23342-1-I1]|nr:hypothetical protein VE03_02017 [Pseudogymnoascus sp. 23342-1-I1]
MKLGIGKGSFEGGELEIERSRVGGGKGSFEGVELEIGKVCDRAPPMGMNSRKLTKRRRRKEMEGKKEEHDDSGLGEDRREPLKEPARRGRRCRRQPPQKVKKSNCQNTNTCSATVTSAIGKKSRWTWEKELEDLVLRARRKEESALGRRKEVRTMGPPISNTTNKRQSEEKKIVQYVL